MRPTRRQLKRLINEEIYRSRSASLGFSPLVGYPSYVFDRSYVTGVLGVHVPLNESYPYSYLLYEEILREQFLFEGFWGDLLQKGKDKLLDAKEGIEKFGKETWAILAAFYEVVKGGTKEIGSFTSSIAKKGINKLLKKIRDVLNWMVAKLPGWDMPTFSDWAQKGLDAIDAIQENVNGLDGWKRVIGFAGLAVGLHWLWDKVGGWIDDFKEKVTEVSGVAEEVIEPIKEWIKETAMEKMKEIGGNTFKKIMSTLASVTSGVKPWWDAAVKVAGGAKLVIDALGASAARFMGRQKAVLDMGLSESIEQGKIMRLTERQLRGIIREEIGRNYHTLDTDPYTWKDYSDVHVEVHPDITSQGWYASVECLSDPSLSSGEHMFTDEQTAEHWARMRSEEIYRATLSERPLDDTDS